MLVSGDPRGAIHDLKIAALEAPSMAEIHLNLGKAYAEIDEWTRAVHEFRKASELRHSYPEADAELGAALLNEGSIASAEVAFRSALRGNPDLESAHYGLARVLKIEGRSAKATIEFEEAQLLLQRKTDAVMSSSLSNQSLRLAAQGKAVEAVAVARRAVELDPDSWMAVYNYGLLLADVGKLNRGIDELQLAISLMPMRRQLYLTMAQMQKQSGDAETAECTIERANHLVLFAPDHELHDAQMLKRKKCRAIEDGFAFGASFGDTKEQSAYAHFLSARGDLLGAAGELMHSIARAPTQSETRYELAILWLQMGRMKSSEMELRDALILAPQSVKANFALGAVLVQLQHYGEAKTQLRRTLILDPKIVEERRMLDELVGHE